jgi:class 3 adenylate cyclase
MKTPAATPTVGEQVIAFADLIGFHRTICSKLSPEEIFAFLSEYYSAAQAALDGSEGRIVKFIGDAMLILHAATDPRKAVDDLRRLKTAMDSFFAKRGHESLFRVKAHIGTVACGSIGTGELERFDVCGVAVNQAALLPDGEWILSDELQKKIGL